VDRFNLEDAIMQAWQTEQDLKLFLEYYMDASEAMSEDEVANTVLGIEKIHSIRMSKLWQVYKQTFKLDEYRAEKCSEKVKDGAEKCDEWLEDGFGSIWRKCNKEDCGKFVVRPGKVDCYNGDCPEEKNT
jgi:hypothetical protein